MKDKIDAFFKKLESNKFIDCRSSILEKKTCGVIMKKDCLAVAFEQEDAPGDSNVYLLLEDGTEQVVKYKDLL